MYVEKLKVDANKKFPMIGPRMINYLPNLYFEQSTEAWIAISKEKARNRSDFLQL